MDPAIATPFLDRLARSPWAYAVLALAVLACALPGVFSLPVLDRDEARFAQATRQMLETGDFVNIMVQDEPRNKKPIGIHWLQSVTAGVTSQSAIWGYRLASVFGALLSAFAIFSAGATLAGRTVGFSAAILFAAALLPSTEGMVAKTDMVLCGFTALAMAALARLYVGHGGRWSALAFWAAVGAGILIKGPITPLVAGLAMLTLFMWERRAAWMRPLRHWTGPALAALVVLPWMVAIGIETQGTFFSQALSDDLGPKVAGGDEGHFGLPGTHLLLAPLLFFPATFALIPAVQLGLRTVRGGPAVDDPHRVRFLMAWALPIWLIFELLPTKLAHYTLPAYPALALLAGMAVTQASAWGRWTRSAGLVLTLLAGAALVALAAYLATYMPGAAPEDERRAVQAAAVGAVALGAAAIALWRCRSAAMTLGVVLAIGAGTAFGLRERLLPEAAELLVSAQTAQSLRREGLGQDPAAPLLIVDFRETSLVFETRTDARLLNGEEAGAQARLGDHIVVNQGPGSSEGFAEGLAARGLAFAPEGQPTVGLNYSNGDPVSLATGRIVAAP